MIQEKNIYANVCIVLQICDFRLVAEWIKILNSLTFIAMTTTDIKNQVAENRKGACVKQ